VNEPSPPSDELLPPTLARQVDQVCDRYEAAWKAGRRPRIDDYLGERPEPERQDLLRGLLVLELAYRRQAGERPTPEEYRSRFPEHTALIDTAFAAVTMPPTASLAPAEQAAGRIGPYKLLHPLGEGGMGTVYLAEQERPIRRRVALKVIKPGMDSAQVIARFEAERQALALMDHPHIARVLDAGTTEGGRPYFVMDLVKGVPITDYCDQNRLAPKERLELFIPICQAIQHAHQKGIIHRDIKPSNVLVTLHDGKAVPKVIDFGIAKAIEQRLTERTLFTQLGAVIGTPEYMSPEQAGLSGLDVDTRSDIYSLGVLLYELLTGSTPLRRETLRQAGFEEMMRRIREEEPPRPSTRLSQSVDTLPSISARRQTEPPRLRKLVRGELDWIVMKALEKDRTRRYETASGLARDLERYLHDEPVEAGPPSAAYRLKKYARKHRVGLATASAFAGVLVVGTVISTVAAIRAMRAEKVAILAENEAKENLLKAQEEEKKAKQSEFKAQAQTQLATDRAEHLAWEDYINRVNRAYREVEDDNVALAEDLLHGCPAERRGWEWHFVKRLCNLERLIVEAGPVSVNAVAFSPDGVWVATGSGASIQNMAAGATGTTEAALDLWDVKSGQRRQAIRGFKGTLFGVAVSPDGQRIAVGSGLGGRQVEAQLTVLDAATGGILWTQNEPGLMALSVAFSPDGKSLAVGYGLYSSLIAGKVKVWDVATWQESLALPGPVGGVNKLAYHPGGKRLAVAGLEGVEVWDLTTRTKVGDLKGHRKWVYTIAFSPDGKWLATGGWDRTIRIWDVASASERSTLSAHAGFVLDLAFSPDSRYLASSGEDRGVRLWEVPSGRKVTSFHGHTGVVSAVAFRPDGREIATAGGSDGTVKFWDLHASRPVIFEGHTGWVVELAFRRDGRRILSESAKYQVEGDTTRGWDPSTSEPDPALTGVRLNDVRTDYEPGVGRYASGGSGLGSNTASPDGKWIVQWIGPSKALPGRGQEDTPNSVLIVDKADGRVIHTLLGHTAAVVCVAFSPDRRRLATASFDRTIKIWDTATGREVFTLLGHTAGVISLAFSPDGNRLASGGIDNTARVWDATPLPADILREHQARHDKERKRFEQHRTAIDATQRAEVFAKAGRWDMAAAALGKAIESTPDDLDLRIRHMGMLLDAGDLAAYRRAASDVLARFGKAIESRPDDLDLRLWHMGILLKAGDLAGYRRAAPDLLARFGKISGPEARFVAWQCVRLPDAVADRDAPVALAEVALAGSPEEGKPICLSVLGAALYRAGRFDEAIRRLNAGIKAGAGGREGNPQDWAFLAMAYHHQGDAVEARRWLDKLLAYKPKASPGFSWRDVEIQLLRREAEALIPASPPAQR
jgi:WD40 repeat protein/serine/threonine protein kinase